MNFKNKRNRLLAFLLIMSLITPIVFNSRLYARAAVTDKDINDAKEEKEKLDKRLEEAQAALDKALSEKKSIESYIASLDSQIDTINKTIYDLSLQIEAKQEEIDITEVELQAAKDDEAEQYANMKLRIRYMYETGQTTYLEAFLASDNISELLNRTEYVQQITAYDKRMMDKLVATRQLVEEKEIALNEQMNELTSLKNDSEAELAAVELVYAAKETELEKAKAAAETAEELQAAVKKERDEADAKVDKLIAQKQKEESEQALKEMEEKLSSKSFLRWPLPASCTVVTELFGPRVAPVTGASTYHYAIDLRASTGTPVYAAADGTVMIAEYNYSYGNFVLIYHEGGVATLYAHASTLLVKPGQTVKKGDTIMLAGNTGYSTGPHLHYEVRVNGVRVNPLNYYNTDGLTYKLD